MSICQRPGCTAEAKNLYCSRSCAVSVNNSAKPKRTKSQLPVCALPGCTNRVKRAKSRFCSTGCRTVARRGPDYQEDVAVWLTDGHRARMRAYMKARYERRRADAIAQLGGRCAWCGSTDDLEFDHVDPRTKTFSIGNRLVGITEDLLQAELAKCQLLCHQHHIEKTSNDSDIPTGWARGPEHVLVEDIRAHI